MQRLLPALPSTDARDSQVVLVVHRRLQVSVRRQATRDRPARPSNEHRSVTINNYQSLPTGSANKKTTPWKKLYISAIVANLSTKLTDFTAEVSSHIRNKIRYNLSFDYKITTIKSTFF